MALFSSSSAFLGLDLGTSTLKVVELIDRRKRIEVTTYGQANVPNLLIDPPGSVDDALRLTGNTISQMLERAAVTTDTVIAALPNSVVFSTVLELPDLPEVEMGKAVHFAARDIVPANLDDMVLGWSRVGTKPHLESTSEAATNAAAPQAAPIVQTATIPVFVTAAPKVIIERYTRLIELLQLRLFALEVETFPLARSLLNTSTDSATLVDLGDQVTTIHVIDRGTAHVSHTLEVGGNAITEALARAMNISREEAERQKSTQGLLSGSPAAVRSVIEDKMKLIANEARRVIEVDAKKTGRKVQKVILIGGGANLPGLTEWYNKYVNLPTAVGNPWRELSYPQGLEARLSELGPRYAVAVGLALRGFNK
jgi:type IV pilus assembly protein PilM